MDHVIVYTGTMSRPELNESRHNFILQHKYKPLGLEPYSPNIVRLATIDKPLKDVYDALLFELNTAGPERLLNRRIERTL